jgi:hypothetical protein
LEAVIDILIREPICEDDNHLSIMLCEEVILRRDLGTAEENRPTREVFVQKTREWCQSRNATTYAIVLRGGPAIGMISLPHVDLEERSARIGYWIGSDYRRRGYGTKALGLVIKNALSKGLESVRYTTGFTLMTFFLWALLTRSSVTPNRACLGKYLAHEAKRQSHLWLGLF